MALKRDAHHQYAHDIQGAAIRAYYRKRDEAVEEAVRNSMMCFGRGMEPRNLRTAVYSVIERVLEEGVRRGLPREEIVHTLATASRDHCVDHVMRDANRKPQRLPENPGRYVTESWEEFDAMVDRLKPDDLAAALKREARMRAEAQADAGIDGGGKP